VIVATAGHVDHGKTSLVRALTGQDTDRLPEEKRRGMSIDLGFAFLPRAGAAPIAFVDVPGHERFVRNMTAGVQGIDLALLVVAADDGPMPQTREHLEILDLLGAPQVLAVLTKADRVAPERLEQATAEVRALLDGTRFRGAAMLAASGTTGEGIDALRRLLEEATAIIRTPPGERFRMHVDREFVIDGLGLVVTGTVLTGSIAAGQAVSVLPRNLRAKVRSLRANSGPAELARAGERCALALQGLSRGEVARGDTVIAGDAISPSKHLDVRVSGKASVKNRGAVTVTVFLGTSAIPAQLALLAQDGIARLTLSREACTWHGDRFLLRDTGSGKLLGGGEIIDPSPPARGASKPQRLEWLRSVAGKSAPEAFDALIAHGPVDLEWLARAWHLEPDEVTRIRSRGAVVPVGSYAVSEAGWQALCAAIERSLSDWHAARPEWLGARAAELRKLLGNPPVLPAAIETLAAGGRIVKDGPYLRLPAHRPVLSAQDESLWQRIAPMLPGSEGRPPRVHELAESLGMEPKAVSAFLERAARAGQCYRIAPNRFFLPDAVERLAALAKDLDEKAGGTGFSAAQFRDASGLGRNLTIQVLEYLDETGYTRRSGELRHATIERTIESTEEQRTPVGRPDFKSGERRNAPLASSTPASSATDRT
jgi:selenocysteine-specific elongation factor